MKSSISHCWGGISISRGIPISRGTSISRGIQKIGTLLLGALPVCRDSMQYLFQGSLERRCSTASWQLLKFLPSCQPWLSNLVMMGKILMPFFWQSWRIWAESSIMYWIPFSRHSSAFPPLPTLCGVICLPQFLDTEPSLEIFFKTSLPL